jgi:hypothetical protein
MEALPEEEKDASLNLRIKQIHSSSNNKDCLEGPMTAS